MRFLCLIYDDESQFATATEEQIGAVMTAYGQFEEEIGKAGVKAAAEPLMPTMTAKTVEVVNGETVATNGPFAETKEQLGGFYMLDVGTDQEALDWAAGSR